MTAGPSERSITTSSSRQVSGPIRAEHQPAHRVVTHLVEVIA